MGYGAKVGHSHFKPYGRTNCGSKFACPWGPFLAGGMFKIQRLCLRPFAVDPENLIEIRPQLLELSCSLTHGVTHTDRLDR